VKRWRRFRLATAAIRVAAVLDSDRRLLDLSPAHARMRTGDSPVLRSLVAPIPIPAQIRDVLAFEQ
jgi:hypothetical protein